MSKINREAFFVIDRDLLDAGTPDTQVARRIRTSGSGPSLQQVRFRLLDDDNVVCYEGTFVRDPQFATDFEPLDWAQGFAGCTAIEYREGDRWVRL